MQAQPAFRPFDESGEVHVYVRNLPHWRQPGATYFVTFRQDDSIPEKILAEWQDERHRWYRAQGIDPRWQRTDPDRFNTEYEKIEESIRRVFERDQAKKIHAELDCSHGSCVLRHQEPQQFVFDAMHFFDIDRLWLGDFVIMPNHVHALIQPRGTWQLEDLLGSIKKWCSRRIGQWLQRQAAKMQPVGPDHNKPRLWQHETYDRIVRDAEELAAFRRYILQNPEKAKLQEGEYAYHAAPWLDSYAPRSDA